MNLGFIFAYPLPDLVSVDIGTVQADGGVVLNLYSDELYLLPDVGFSIGQARLYWGEMTAFVAGVEPLRFEFAKSPVSGMFGTSELFMPEIGIKSEYPVKAVGCLNPFNRESFVPRMDLVCGFSTINPVLSSIAGQPIRFLPTLRIEARFFLSRMMQIVLENRNIWGYDEASNTLNTFHLSLCLAFGADYKKQWRIN